MYFEKKSMTKLAIKSIGKLTKKLTRKLAKKPNRKILPLLNLRKVKKFLLLKSEQVRRTYNPGAICFVRMSHFCP